jgi:hypothetical protein
MSGWRHRCSAVANRHALSSDYYSRKKITVTPLNFVCKCRAEPPPRKHPKVFGKIGIEQTFAHTRICDLFCTCLRSADELRVFITRHRLLFARARARTSIASAQFRGCESTGRNGFTKPKFFCGEPPKKALRPASSGAKRTNRRRSDSLRRRTRECLALAHDTRAGEIFADARRRARNFSRARTPKAVALRYRDAS